MSTHYSFAQQPEELRKWARLAVNNLLETIKLSNKIPMLCYTGMSGVSAATALMLELNNRSVHVEMCYVRKSNEISHGLQLEISTHEAFDRFIKIFVDDFICSGCTFGKVELEIGRIDVLVLQENRCRNSSLPRELSSYTIIYGE